MTLDGIMDIESKYLQKRAASRRGSVASNKDAESESVKFPIGDNGASLQPISTEDEKAAIAGAAVLNGAPGSPALSPRSPALSPRARAPARAVIEHARILAIWFGFHLY